MRLLMRKLLMLEKHHKIIVSMVLMSICLVSTVKALGVGPLDISLSVEKGKETEIVEYIQVLNSEPKPIHVTVSVSGPVSEFLTVEPSEFTLPAGPGLFSREPSPTQNVKLRFTIPREVPEIRYTGEILFKEKPVGGGVIGAGIVLGTNVDLTIGKMAVPEFPTYIAGISVVLVILIISLPILVIYGRRGL